MHGARHQHRRCVAGHSPVADNPPALKTYGQSNSPCGCAGGGGAADEAELQAITRAVLERLKNLK